jgi:hypothetical protein
MMLPIRRLAPDGGARVITHVYVEATIVYLLAIYDKSEQGSIDEKQILSLLASIKK